MCQHSRILIVSFTISSKCCPYIHQTNLMHQGNHPSQTSPLPRWLSTGLCPHPTEVVQLPDTSSRRKTASALVGQESTTTAPKMWSLSSAGWSKGLSMSSGWPLRTRLESASRASPLDTKWPSHHMVSQLYTHRYAIIRCFLMDFIYLNLLSITCKPCNLCHYMFTKVPSSLDFLKAHNLL